MASLTISCRPVSFAQRITLANEPADGAQLPSSLDFHGPEIA